jgi:hypothetical protein
MIVNKILIKIYIGFNDIPTFEEISHFSFYCSREIENILDPHEITVKNNSISYSVSETSYNKDDLLLTIDIGCDTFLSLDNTSSNFLDVFESLAADLVDPERNEYGLKADVVDFTNLQYQSYDGGSFDEGNFSDSDNYDDLIEDFKSEIEERKESNIKVWLFS